VTSDEQDLPAEGADSEVTGQELTRHISAEPFPIEITDILDLHTFQPKEIPAVVEAYLEEARSKGFTTVRLIHGKGIGVQRERVHAILRRTPFVEQFQTAPGEAGSWGATIVWFKHLNCDENASEGDSH
jgi:dsDNA-specific endonuclease/ATPase MutS2